MKPTHKVALLAYGVKFFFVPLIVFWMTENLFLIKDGITTLFSNGIQESFSNFDIYSQKTFFFLFNTIIFIDVFWFTLGYLIEHPKL